MQLVIVVSSTCESRTELLMSHGLHRGFVFHESCSRSLPSNHQPSLPTLLDAVDARTESGKSKVDSVARRLVLGRIALARALCLKIIMTRSGRETRQSYHSSGLRIDGSMNMLSLNKSLR